MLDSCLGLMDLRADVIQGSHKDRRTCACVLKGVGSDSCSSCLLWNITVDELLCVAHYVHISLFPLSRHASSSQHAVCVCDITHMCLL